MRTQRRKGQFQRIYSYSLEMWKLKISEHLASSPNLIPYPLGRVIGSLKIFWKNFPWTYVGISKQLFLTHGNERMSSLEKDSRVSFPSVDEAQKPWVEHELTSQTDILDWTLTKGKPSERLKYHFLFLKMYLLCSFPFIYCKYIFLSKFFSCFLLLSCRKYD